MKHGMKWASFFLETDFTTTFFSCFEYSHSKRLLNEEEELLELVGAKKRGWVANKQAPYSNTKKYLQQVSLKTESILFYDSKIVGTPKPRFSNRACQATFVY